MKKNILAVSLVLLLSSSVAMAVDHSKMDHSKMNQGDMNKEHNMTSDKMSDDADHAAMEMATEGTGTAIIHSVSKLNRTVNLTHSPIAELNWPEMTMDLPVVDDVDLNDLKSGDDVEIHIVLGEDKVYRIHHIAK